MSGLFGGGSTTIAQTPVAATSPPVTADSAEVVQSQQDYRRQMLKKRGFENATVFAGNTGGFTPANPNPSPTNPKAPNNASGSPGARTLGS